LNNGRRIVEPKFWFFRKLLQNHEILIILKCKVSDLLTEDQGRYCFSKLIQISEVIWRLLVDLSKEVLLFILIWSV